MKNLIKMELKKAIVSKFFLMGLLLLLLLSILSGIYMIENRATYNPEVINEHILQADGTYKNNPDLPIFGLLEEDFYFCISEFPVRKMIRVPIENCTNK